MLYVWTGSVWTQLPGVFVQPSGFNFLVNSHFAYNGRNQSSYTAQAWTVDGWFSPSGSATITLPGGVTATNAIAVAQPIQQYEQLFGKQATFSVKDADAIYTVTATMPNSAQGTDAQIAAQATPWGDIAIWNISSLSAFAVVISVSSAATLEAAKLELGATSTLAADLAQGQDEAVEQLRLDLYDLDPGRPAYILTQNENLLDNWYFVGGGSQQGGGQFPINQRGQTSYTGPNYGIDRWIASQTRCVAQLNANGVQLNTSVEDAFLCQKPENGQGLSGTITFSVLSEASSRYATARIIVFCSDQTVDVHGGNTQLSTISVNLDSYPNIISIEIRAGNLSANESTNLIAAKLELGYLSTLARKDEEGNWVLNDPPPNFQQELAKCQRMYQIYSSATERPSNGYDCRPVMRLAAPSQGTILINDQTWYYNDANL